MIPFNGNHRGSVQALQHGISPWLRIHWPKMLLVSLADFLQPRTWSPGITLDTPPPQTGSRYPWLQVCMLSVRVLCNTAEVLLPTYESELRFIIS